MSLAIVHSRALDGLKAPEVTVEVHLANGLPSFTLVGLADTEVKEARERVRAALSNAGLEFPFNKRVTVNLAPADLPKESGRFDLPIALGILAAMGHLDGARLAELEFAGELSLGGELRPVRGALPMALALRRGANGPRQRGLVLPQVSAQEAALVDGVRLYGAAHLLEVVAALRPADQGAGGELIRARAAEPPLSALSAPDLRDVKGQSAAKRALEVAAAGGHSLMMVGPPGTGKSMLAQRFAGLLPLLNDDEALESAAVLSLAGCFDAGRWRHRLMRSPHHTASSVALVGGGSPPRPGEISLAHHGILFLDELPEFPRAALEALREPLETGHITIARAARRHDFPARFQLIAAMNPCPCGHFGNPLKACRCTPDQVARYQSRLSGPLLDRIDVQIEVPAVPPDVLAACPDGESSSDVAARVLAARERQRARQGVLNADLSGGLLEAHLRAEAAASVFLQSACTRLGWSGRAFHRVLKLARTIADLSGAESIKQAHMAEAIQYRRVLQQV
ncbi:MAG TPA: YifB family Mg chelatase-like AAA ATPase [Aquabacterium sp.]|uniref:YifB family Mg chelatase-like AAA ATPase n=1 Tax=Aquabacterium sp. TaxID=1872578 RepID=UPI002E363093|nr:YifB family Mg chelatase-like AAA ATPase [Aquabacterium sp.]HEX5356699.1 YifB family Mg chelatase-like AAA ATPase [Aquabacterium sp.]